MKSCNYEPDSYRPPLIKQIFVTSGLLGFISLAALTVFPKDAAAQTCPRQFSGATYDLKLVLNSQNNYFRRARTGTYCKVDIDRRRNIAKTNQSSRMERQSDGDLVFFVAGRAGTWNRWLFIRTTNANCGRETDLFGRSQIKFCTRVWRRSGDRWVQPRNSWGHWLRNTANRPPRTPSGLSPDKNAMTGTTVTLRWTNNGDPDRDRVRFYLRIWLWNGGAWQQSRATFVKGTSYTLRNLPRGTSVYWRVWANDESNSWSRPASARFRTARSR